MYIHKHAQQMSAHISEHEKRVLASDIVQPFSSPKWDPLVV